MFRRQFSVFLMPLAFVACAVEPASQANSAAQANIPERYAGFAGRWTGFWDGPGETATVLNVLSINPDGQIRGTYQFRQFAPTQFNSKIENNAFSFGSAAQFTFTLLPNGRLSGTRMSGSQFDRITLSRR